MQKYLGHTVDSVSKPGIDAFIWKTLGITCKNANCIESKQESNKIYISTNNIILSFLCLVNLCMAFQNYKYLSMLA